MKTNFRKFATALVTILALTGAVTVATEVPAFAVNGIRK